MGGVHLDKRRTPRCQAYVHLDSRRGQARSDLGVGASEVEEEFNLLRLHLWRR
jgi:hypothetical protein